MSGVAGPRLTLTPQDDAQRGVAVADRSVMLKATYLCVFLSSPGAGKCAAKDLHVRWNEFLYLLYDAVSRRVFVDVETLSCPGQERECRSVIPTRLQILRLHTRPRTCSSG
jgi:hypothetical protein